MTVAQHTPLVLIIAEQPLARAIQDVLARAGYSLGVPEDDSTSAEASEARPVSKVIRRGRLVIDIGRRRVELDGKLLSLTPAEFRILQCLAAQPDQVLSRDEIVRATHGGDAPVTARSIDPHINTLRRKLASSGIRIETVRGFGYTLI